MYLLGYDIGSSSVKAALVDAATGKSVASDFFPKNEADKGITPRDGQSKTLRTGGDISRKQPLPFLRRVA